METPAGPEEQRVYYHNGAGTGLSTKDRWIGGAAGLGLGHTVRGAYKFVSQHYKDGIEIYLFGFSRGAFTARSLAGYISASGLLKPEFCSPDNEARAWRYYNTAPDDRFPNEREELRKLSFDNVRIRLIGVFDTVGALGVPLEWFGSWNRRRFQFPRDQPEATATFRVGASIRLAATRNPPWRNAGLQRAVPLARPKRLPKRLRRIAL